MSKHCYMELFCHDLSRGSGRRNRHVIGNRQQILGSPVALRSLGRPRLHSTTPEQETGSTSLLFQVERLSPYKHFHERPTILSNTTTATATASHLSLIFSRALSSSTNDATTSTQLSAQRQSQATDNKHTNKDLTSHGQAQQHNGPPPLERKESLSSLRTRLRGDAVVGTPLKGSSPAGSSTQRLLLPLERDASTFNVSKTLSTIKQGLLAVDAFIGRLVIGTFKTLYTAITQPSMIIVWSRNGWKAIKEEAKHYWSGLKLLGVEIGTSTKLLRRKLGGHTLTRRERKQLVRTSADIFRLIPMSLFVVVPFMEFTLPFVLKIFPGILPSTFQDQHKQEENMKNLLKLRLDLATILQEMVVEMGMKSTADKHKITNQQSSVKAEGKETNEIELTVSELERFINDTRLGKQLPSEVLYKITKLFSDELTIENMSRPELALLCRYMGIAPFGGDNFLRYQLRQNINHLREDDRVIYFEGVDSLNLFELKQACQERGMRATGLTRDQLKRQLSHWLDFSMNRNVSTSLLILSRAFIINEFGEEKKYDDAINDAIGQIDQNITKLALAENLSSVQGVKTDSKTLTEMRLEAIKLQNKLIEAEKTSASAAALTQKERKESSSSSEENRYKLIIEDPMKDIAKKEKEGVSKQNNIVAEFILDSKKGRQLEEQLKKTDLVQITVNQDLLHGNQSMAQVLESLKVLSSGSPVETEKKQLQLVLSKQEQLEADQAITVGRIKRVHKGTTGEGTSSTLETGKPQVEITAVPVSVTSVNEKESMVKNTKLSKEQEILQKRIQKMLKKIEEEVDKTDASIGDRLKVLDPDNDGIVTNQELRVALSEHFKEKYSEVEIEKILAMLDLDHDGVVSIEEMNRVADLIVEKRKQEE